MRTLAFLTFAALVAVPGLATAASYDFEAHDQYFTRAGETAQNPTLTVEPGESVTINLVQIGVQPHNWVLKGVAGANTSFINTPGQTTSVTFTAPESGNHEYYCQAHPTTMKGTLAIQGAGGDTGGDTGGNDGGNAGGDGGNESPGVGLLGVLAVLGVAMVLTLRRRA